jgi:hypothetical protein
MIIEANFNVVLNLHVYKMMTIYMYKMIKKVYLGTRRKADRNKEISLITMCWEKWISLKSDHDVLENKV